MNLSTTKDFTEKAKDYVSFYNEDGEPRLNVEGVVEVSGGGSSGGGFSSYSTASGDFTATPNDGTNTVTISGLPFTLEAQHVIAGSTIKIDSSGDVTSVPTSNVTVSSGIITYGNASSFSSSDTMLITIVGPDKAYDKPTDSTKTIQQNPEWAHYTSPEHIVSFSATGASTTRVEIQAAGYKNLSIHWKLVTTNAGDTTTLTFWATNNSNADTSADTDWVDISTLVLGAASKSANNSTEEDIMFIDTSMVPLKYMVKVVTTTGGTNTNAADVYIVKA